MSKREWIVAFMKKRFCCIPPSKKAPYSLPAINSFLPPPVLCFLLLQAKQGLPEILARLIWGGYEGADPTIELDVSEDMKHTHLPFGSCPSATCERRWSGCAGR